ncbi:MAG: radical SAM protein, partial [Actinomycetota bacterium]
PKDFRADSVRAMAECSVVCEHIHLPLQSGSDRVLKSMKRAYTKRRYLEKVAMVRDAIPDVAITTDIIVGFPGETEEDFEQTLEVAEAARYDSAYTFQYSPRPMTAAAEMPDQIPKEVVQERFDRLVDLQTSVSLERNERHVGQELDVLVEGVSRRDPSKLTGRTRHNKLVHFGGNGAAEGSIQMVRINGAHPHHLEGEPKGGRATTDRRARLPLAAAPSGSGCS